MNPLVENILVLGFGVLVLGVAVTAGALAVAAYELRGLRRFISTRRIKVEVCAPAHSPSGFTTLLGSPGGYAIYVFRQGKWLLEADLSNSGYEAVPPSVAGVFEGQVVKKASGLK